MRENREENFLIKRALRVTVGESGYQCLVGLRFVCVIHHQSLQLCNRTVTSYASRNYNYYVDVVNEMSALIICSHHHAIRQRSKKLKMHVQSPIC